MGRATISKRYGKLSEAKFKKWLKLACPTFPGTWQDAYKSAGGKIIKKEKD